ncbi:hypothetical protein [Parasphaerochaeta coccoides]|uniref:Uncharacterized protein n=1 Tax=Parasphaerochaeta coccoides (strain ATCC BAA-1237 / DSM 17374 / SPN1) TaxID=760011 RepID=F4GM45_PARC1|nr:hypothetical protein [Parasphaerochaeta coccoides]AEC02520.1 hypothetical protein Spico_1312 [Parasphaerochaeta coccoides DSM 17374]
MKKVFIVVLIIGAILLSLYGYGYYKASNQVKNGTLNLITLAMTYDSLNPISQKGYIKYIKDNTDAPARINSFFEGFPGQ